MDERNVVVALEVELAREKAETRRMARQLREKKSAVKRTKELVQRISRANEQRLSVNRRMQNMVDDFLIVADAENNDPETTTMWTEIAMREIIEGMNCLNQADSNSSSFSNGTSADNGDSS